MSWVVGRPLASAGTDFAVKAETIDEVLAGDPPTGGFRDYMDAVVSIAPSRRTSSWRRLCICCHGFQEIRRLGSVIWHNGGTPAASEGDNPQTKAVERHLLMRAILGLLDLKEPQLRLAIERAQGKSGGIGRLGRLESELKGKTELANEGALEVLGKRCAKGSGGAAIAVDSMIEVLREGLEDLRSARKASGYCRTRKVESRA